MSADIKVNFRWPEFPKGNEGVAKVVELVNSVMFKVNPFLEPEADRLVTKPSQVHDLSQDELDDKRVIILKERIIFRLFQILGIPEKTLQPVYFPTEKVKPFYCEPVQSQPELYIEKSIKDGLDADDPRKRVLTALKLGGLFIQTNFNLSVDPADVPDNSRVGAVRTIRKHMYGSLLMNMASIFGDQVDPLAFEAIGGIVSSLESRVMTNGGMLCLLLAHQTVNTAEITAGGDLHSALILYYAKQTIEEFMRSVSNAGFTAGVKVKLPPEVVAADVKIKDRFDRLKDPKVDRTFAAFRRSQLPFSLID